MDAAKGRVAVGIARKTIELWVRENKKFMPGSYPDEFNEKRGVFVTIHTYPQKDLRGCIGFPEPQFPLIRALVEAAVYATSDPRFPPLVANELGKVIVEVSVLTKPEIINANPSDYPKKIRIGKDGLIIRKGLCSGLLLPQVATEYCWDAKEFLSHTCMKAGLAPDSWHDKDAKIYRFQSEIFSEAKPNKI